MVEITETESEITRRIQELTKTLKKRLGHDPTPDEILNAATECGSGLIAEDANEVQDD